MTLTVDAGQRRAGGGQRRYSDAEGHAADVAARASWPTTPTPTATRSPRPGQRPAHGTLSRSTRTARSPTSTPPATTAPTASPTRPTTARSTRTPPPSRSPSPRSTTRRWPRPTTVQRQRPRDADRRGARRARQRHRSRHGHADGGSWSAEPGARQSHAERQRLFTYTPAADSTGTRRSPTRPTTAPPTRTSPRSRSTRESGADRDQRCVPRRRQHGTARRHRRCAPPGTVVSGSVLANDTDPDSSPSPISVTAFDATSGAGARCR